MVGFQVLSRHIGHQNLRVKIRLPGNTGSQVSTDLQDMLDNLNISQQNVQNIYKYIPSFKFYSIHVVFFQNGDIIHKYAILQTQVVLPFHNKVN